MWIGSQFKLLICLGLLLIFTQASQAQYLLDLSKQDCIELSLDLIRKGIQQSDIAKVMEVTGSSVLVNGVETKTKNKFTQELSLIFSNSSKRKMVTGVRALSKPKSSPTASNLWDFDILAPIITVNGDSAVVECELILWGAESADITRVGSRVTERLVFFSPYEGQSELTASNNPHRWQLVECNSLLDFLEDYGGRSVQKESNNEVKQ